MRSKQTESMDEFSKDHASEDKALLEHVALECMQAIEMKDKSMFLESFQVLISHILEEMMEGPKQEIKEGEE